MELLCENRTEKDRSVDFNINLQSLASYASATDVKGNVGMIIRLQLIKLALESQGLDCSVTYYGIWQFVFK